VKRSRLTLPEIRNEDDRITPWRVVPDYCNAGEEACGL
jgi:hypothetical protein